MIIACNAGYNIPITGRSNATVSCKNGVWSGPFQCKPIRCHPLTLLQNYDLGIFDYTEITDYSPGSNVTVTCMDGLFIKGQSTVEL